MSLKKLRRRLSRLEFRKKLSILVLLFSFLPFFIIGIIYVSQAWTSRIDRLTGEFDKSVEGASSDIDGIFKSNFLKINYINNNSIYRKLLGKNLTDDMQEVYTLFRNVHEAFMAYTSVDGQQTSLRVYVYNSKAYLGEYTGLKEDLDPDTEKRILAQMDSKIIMDNRILRDLNTKRERHYFNIYKTVLADIASGQTGVTAITELRLPVATVANALKFELPADTFVVYMGESQKPVLLKSNAIPQEKADEVLKAYQSRGTDSHYRVSSFEVKSTGGRLYTFIPISHFYKQMRSFILLCIIITVSVIVIIYLSIKYSTMKVTGRLENLMRQTRTNIKSLILDADTARPEEEDEFSRLSELFQRLLLEIKEHYRKESEYAIEKKSLELALLQERINPHMLYNSLSSIKWAFPDTQLRTVIDCMVKYYRTTLNKGNDLLRVRDEISMVEEYMKLQQFAYRSDFKYEIRVDNALLDNTIFKHLLQPIVENAILHGINALKSGGKIIIEGKLADDRMQFSVSDNGCGMEQERIDEIFKGEYRSKYGGYGARNIIKRLEIFYGDDFDLTINSVLDQGTTVLITVPVSPKSQQNSAAL